MFHRIVLAACALSAAVPLGCGRTGPPTYGVEGRVTYRGQPLPLGTVSFLPEKGVLAAAGIGHDGRFSLRLPAGHYGVAVNAVQPPPSGVDLLETNYVPPPPLVPTKYARLATSGLAAHVEPRHDNRVDFDLQ